MKLLLVRHAQAGVRGAWDQDDSLRPLSPEGWAEASAIADTFGAFGIDRIASSRAVRCVQTVEPLAARTGVSVEIAPELFEGADVGRLVAFTEATTVNAAFCTHGDLIPELLRILVNRGMELTDQFRWEKGSTWVIEREGDRFVEASYVSPRPRVD